MFTLKTAREYLSDEAYKSLVASIKSGKKIDRNDASQIAAGIRQWAQKKGATHYTHWFQPLTGTSAEKHDSFFTLKGDGTPIEEFDGAALIQHRQAPHLLLQPARALLERGPLWNRRLRQPRLQGKDRLLIHRAPVRRRHRLEAFVVGPHRVLDLGTDVPSGDALGNVTTC